MNLSKILLSFRRCLYNLFIYSFNIIFQINPLNISRIIQLKCVGAKVPFSSQLSRKVRFDFPWRLRISSNCFISENVYLDCRGGYIHIDANTDISYGAIIYTLTHDIDSKNFSIYMADVFIGKRVWIAAKSIVTPGVKIADGTVLSANSVLTKDTKKNSLYIGINAKFVKKLNTDRASSVRSV